MSHIKAIAQAGPRPRAPSGHTWESLMAMALNEAKKGAIAGEIPVGALIVQQNGEILARAHNLSISNNDPTAHAEMLVLRKAGKKIGNYRLHNTILIVTLEPCLMCTGALIHARIEGLVFGATDQKSGTIASAFDGLEQNFHNHKLWYMGGILAHECAQSLKNFFKR